MQVEFSLCRIKGDGGDVLVHADVDQRQGKVVVVRARVDAQVVERARLLRQDGGRGPRAVGTGRVVDVGGHAVIVAVPGEGIGILRAGDAHGPDVVLAGGQTVEVELLAVGRGRARPDDGPVGADQMQVEFPLCRVKDDGGDVPGRAVVEQGQRKVVVIRAGVDSQAVKRARLRRQRGGRGPRAVGTGRVVDVGGQAVITALPARGFGSRNGSTGRHARRLGRGYGKERRGRAAGLRRGGRCSVGGGRTGGQGGDEPPTSCAASQAAAVQGNASRRRGQEAWGAGATGQERCCCVEVFALPKHVEIFHAHDCSPFAADPLSSCTISCRCVVSLVIVHQMLTCLTPSDFLLSFRKNIKMDTHKQLSLEQHPLTLFLLLAYPTFLKKTTAFCDEITYIPFQIVKKSNKLAR